MHTYKSVLHSSGVLRVSSLVNGYRNGQNRDLCTGTLSNVHMDKDKVDTVPESMSCIWLYATESTLLGRKET